MFLTNNFSLAAATIAAIYKNPWQVELFFKAIKQNLKIKAFVGLLRNVMLTQVWIAMITYLLVAFARHSAKAGWTVQRILRLIQLNLFERRSLLDMLKPDPPRPKKKRTSDEVRFVTVKLWDSSAPQGAFFVQEASIPRRSPRYPRPPIRFHRR